MQNIMINEDIFLDMADKIDRIYKILNKQPNVGVKPSILDEYMDFETTRKVLRCSARTLHRWKDMGFIPFKKLEKKIYFLIADIELFISDRLKEKPGDRKITLK